MVELAAAKEHDRIIAAAAKAALTPIGFWRKGRSRVWLADNGFWLNVVEFQPSAWSRGSYLNICVHWLRGLVDGLSLDDIEGRIRSFVRFESPDQFQPLALKQAADAAAESLRLRSRFSTIEAIATQLVGDANSGVQDGRPAGWPAYHAAVALGLIGDAHKSQVLLEALLRSFSDWETGQKYVPVVEHMLMSVADRAAFCGLIEDQINEKRATFGLKTANGLFQTEDA